MDLPEESNKVQETNPKLPNTLRIKIAVYIFFVLSLILVLITPASFYFDNSWIFDAVPIFFLAVNCVAIFFMPSTFFRSLIFANSLFWFVFILFGYTPAGCEPYCDPRLSAITGGLGFMARAYDHFSALVDAGLIAIFITNLLMGIIILVRTIRNVVRNRIKGLR